MFQGFISQNAPAIQIWDSFATQASTSASRKISLQDDCAPIQIFKTGTNTTAISVYLPNSPVEGRCIKIINSPFMYNKQSINIYSSDRSAFSSGNATTSPIYIVGAGQTLDLCFSSTALSFGTSNSTGFLATGWISLNQAMPSSYSYDSISFGRNNSITGHTCAILSGEDNGINNNYNVILGGQSNSIDGVSSIICTGYYNTISNTATYANIVGGRFHSINSNYGTIGGGDSNSILAAYGTIAGGYTNTVNSSFGTVVGGAYGDTRTLYANTVLSSNATAGVSGTAQKTISTYSNTTTNATATILSTDGSTTASSTNQLNLPNNAAFYFKGEAIAAKTAAGNTKVWTIEGVIKRGANAASTVFVGTPTVTSNFADAGAAAWTLALTTNTSLGGLTITVTGQASTTIRWVVTLDVTETTQ
jgi:hypothetical protein